MQIAAIAYTKLTPEAKAKVDALIKRNPDYQTWIGCLPADQVEKLAFVRASLSKTLTLSVVCGEV